MFLDMALFAYMAYNYKPTDRFWLNDNEETVKDGDKKHVKQGQDNPALEDTKED